MPDEITIHLTAVLQFTPAQFAAMLLRHEAEKHPAIAEILEGQDQYEPLLATSAPQPPPEPPAEPVQPLPEPPPPPPPPEPPAPVARAGRPPRANGKTPPVKAAEPEPEPPAPEPEKPLEEAEVRAVLRLYSTIVPGRDTAVVKLLETIGGAPRLADCPKETWRDIIYAAQQHISENAKPA